MKNSYYRKMYYEKQRLLLQIAILEMLEQAYFMYEHKKGCSWL